MKDSIIDYVYYNILSQIYELLDYSFYLLT